MRWNKWVKRWAHLLLISSACFSACKKASDFSITSVTDRFDVQAIRIGELPLYTEGYGIAVGAGNQQSFEVNIPAKQSHNVKFGQSALAKSISSSKLYRCQVTRVLKDVSRETNQAIAWLKPVEETEIPSGEFVFTQIELGIKKKALLVPKTAVLIRDGRTWVLKEDPSKNFFPTPIQLGIESDDHVEVIAGVKDSDLIIKQGGIGLLSPSFSQKGSSD